MFVNGGTISLGMAVIPPPAGMNPSDLESVKANIHLFQPQHFVVPFLAHALGSLVGGLLAALIAPHRKMTFALVIGGLHLLGGIAAAVMIAGPLWFIALDLAFAYLPMAWLGGKLGGSDRFS